MSIPKSPKVQHYFTIKKEEWEAYVKNVDEDYENMLEMINILKERLAEYETWEISK
jgi:uncharacterized protein YutE (UPF0331/DUF86 family)